jgi:hypothetical protein
MIGDGDCREIGGMKIGRGNRSTRKKTYPSATLSTTNPTWLDPGLNPGRRGGKPATNRFSYGAALSLVLVYSYESNRHKKISIFFFHRHKEISSSALNISYIILSIRSKCVIMRIYNMDNVIFRDKLCIWNTQCSCKWFEYNLKVSTFNLLFKFINNITQCSCVVMEGYRADNTALPYIIWI